jgi:AraC-like DNA-binding protein
MLADSAGQRKLSAAAAGDWARYWRSPTQPLEAMHAHFSAHVYHRHSHETYSFGVTETGAQTFGCRGVQHVSAAGMVMAFNPDDPHDGHSATAGGFTYRMVHIGPGLMSEVMADVAGRDRGLPLFGDPVLGDQWLAARVRALHAALTGQGSGLEVYERLTDAVRGLDRHATRPGGQPRRDPAIAGPAGRVRAYLHDCYASQVSAGDLARAAGSSRYAAYRAFRAAYGLAPSDYQRQLRLRAARRLLAQGVPAAEIAASVGFADQAHLTRWFRRYYGITPGEYRTWGPARPRTGKEGLSRIACCPAGWPG